MFRRLEKSLPGDPVFPNNLKELGYFINEDDLIRKIDYPTDAFQFFISSNARYNDVHREAMHDCIRREIVERLARHNIVPLYLPSLTTDRPLATTPHMPILCTQPNDLRSKRRVIVILNRSQEDLGVLSYRLLSKSGGIANGSVESLVKEIENRADRNGVEEPGVIILNAGQTLYSYKAGKALTWTSWDALPRKSAVHPAAKVDPNMNKIEGNKTDAEHVRFVFDNIVQNSDFVAPAAHLYLLGIEGGGDVVMDYLAKTPEVAERVKALALAAPLPAYTQPPSVLSPVTAFPEFLSARARSWVLSEFPLNTPLANATPLLVVPEEIEQPESNDSETHLFPQLSAGVNDWSEHVVPASHNAMFDWFEEVMKLEGQGIEYENEKMEIPEEVIKAFKDRKRGVEEPAWDGSDNHSGTGM